MIGNAGHGQEVIHSWISSTCHVHKRLWYVYRSIRFWISLYSRFIPYGPLYPVLRGSRIHKLKISQLRHQNKTKNKWKHRGSRGWKLSIKASTNSSPSAKRKRLHSSKNKPWDQGNQRSISVVQELKHVPLLRFYH